MSNQLLITAIVLTLFLPCVAQLQIMLKESGWQTALAIVMFVFPFAFLTGYIINQLFILLGVNRELVLAFPLP